MNFESQSDNLILRVLNESSAKLVLDFYTQNKDFFKPFEIEKPTHFYTLAFQKTLLTHEFNDYIKNKYARFFLFDAHIPDRIIGTISFFDMKKNGFFSCQIGYKIDSRFINRGYGYKMLSLSIPLITLHFGIHRFEAYVLPENDSSIHLLKKFGFIEEGIAHSYAMLNGTWHDHLRYAYITEQKSSSVIK
jgi:ribosomal-protein-alanine N-acetyltransferase